MMQSPVRLKPLIRIIWAARIPMHRKSNLRLFSWPLFFLKLNINNAENFCMRFKEKDSLTDAQKNVEHLRYTIKKYQIVGIEPPVNIFMELKMARLLVTLESTDCFRIDVKD